MVLGDTLQIKLRSSAVSCSVLWSMKRASGVLKMPRLLLQRSLLSHHASIRLATIIFEMLDVIDACRGRNTTFFSEILHFLKKSEIFGNFLKVF
jgi:hypothetical protein